MSENKAKLLQFALILLLVFSSGCLGLTEQAFSTFPPWFLPVTTVVILAFLIISLVYMAGTIFGIPELIAWSKNELYQTAGIALMIGMLMLFFSFLDTLLFPGLTATATGGPFNISTNHIMDAAQGYIGRVNTVLSAQFMTMLYLQIVLGRFEHMMLKLMPGGVGFLLYVGSIFTPFSHFIGYSMNLIGIAIWSIQLQSAILTFSERYMLTLFLPLGILFRAFPYTRSVGGAFIAIAIGLYVIYPVTFILNITILEDHYNQSLLKADGLTAATFKLTKYELPGSGGAMDTFNFAWYVVRLIIISGVSIFFVPTILFAQLLGGDAILEDIAYSITIYAIVLPILNVFMTLTFTRALSQLFGADVNLNSITRLL